MLDKKPKASPRSRYVIGGRKPISISIPFETYAEIQKLAKRQKISVNEWMLRAVEIALKPDRE